MDAAAPEDEEEDADEDEGEAETDPEPRAPQWRRKQSQVPSGRPISQ